MKVQPYLREYNWIRCCEVGIEYKKLVRSLAELQWGRSTLFIHKTKGKSTYTITDKNSGMAVLEGLKEPTVRAARLYLARNCPARDCSGHTTGGGLRTFLIERMWSRIYSSLCRVS